MGNFRNKTDFGEVLISGFGWEASVRDEPQHRTSYLSHPVKGDGLVHRASGQHTIQIHTINFNGNIAIDCTLDTNPDCATWIHAPLMNTSTGNVANILQYVYNPPVPGVRYSGATVDQSQFFVASGQYAWLRANVINTTTGLIDLIKLSF